MLQLFGLVPESTHIRVDISKSAAYVVLFIRSEVILGVKGSVLDQSLSDRARELGGLLLIQILGVMAVKIGHVLEVLLWIIADGGRNGVVL